MIWWVALVIATLLAFAHVVLRAVKQSDSEPEWERVCDGHEVFVRSPGPNWFMRNILDKGDGYHIILEGKEFRTEGVFVGMQEVFSYPSGQPAGRAWRELVNEAVEVAVTARCSAKKAAANRRAWGIE